jgi:hypothetical protein
VYERLDIFAATCDKNVWNILRRVTRKFFLIIQPLCGFCDQTKIH